MFHLILASLNCSFLSILILVQQAYIVGLKRLNIKRRDACFFFLWYFFWGGQSFSWFILSYSNLVSGRVSGNIIDGEISWFRQGPKCYERSRWVCHIFDQFPADTFEEVRPKTGVVEYYHSKSFILEFHYTNSLATWPVSRRVEPLFFVELSIIKVKHCRHWAAC